MPRNWVVSCHAAAQVQNLPSLAFLAATELVELKSGITFMQFTSEAIGLDGTVGWHAYNYLMQSPPNFDAARRIPGCREFKGKSLPNYTMWADDWRDSNNLSACGMFVAGDTWHRDPVTLYFDSREPGSGPSLKDFFAWSEVKSGDVVWWLACKSWMRYGQGISFPSQPVPQPVLPLGLRAPARQRANAVSQKT